MIYMAYDMAQIAAVNQLRNAYQSFISKPENGMKVIDLLGNPALKNPLFV